MTKVVKNIKEWRNLRKSETGTKSLGLVPTMGALHDGHLSLIERSLEENELTIVSSFVNPTQFNDKNDLANYPKSFEDDLKKLEALKVDYLFYPDYEEIYHDQYRYSVIEKELSNILCGSYREGHFEGVLTVVMKLLNIIQPQRAYFGEKDYQQYLLIKEMVEAFFMDVEIIPCPIVREKDGLAMSSRNLRLGKDDRAKAALFPELLKNSPTPEEAADKLSENGFRVDYIEEYNGRRLGAVHLGNVRLIDNVKR